MSDREPMTTINGERMTWAAALEAEGLPYDPRLAGRALDYHDLRKMTREAVKVTAPKTAAAPTATPAIAIPDQLRRDDLRFILVKQGSKGAQEVGWTTDTNYPHGSVTLTLHLGRGLNYGCFPAAGSRLVIIDADHLNRLVELGALDALPETFAIASGSSTPEHPKRHLIYEIEGGPLIGKKVFFDPETDGDDEHLGEVFAQQPNGAGGFIVGPGSIHATTGRPYTVLADVPIASLSREAWMRFANAVRWQRERPPRTGPPAPVTVPRGDSFGSLIGITIGQVWPVPSDAEVSGEWKKFAHPIHGSKNGNNLAVHESGGVFYCHRCGSSGDALTALAVDAGIIHCEDARPGCLAGRALMEQVKDEARRRNYPVDEAERQQRIAYLKATMPPPYASVDVAAIRASIDETIRAAGARVEAER